MRPPDAQLSDLSDPVFLDGDNAVNVFDKATSKMFLMEGESLWEISALASKFKIFNESAIISRKKALEESLW